MVDLRGSTWGYLLLRPPCVGGSKRNTHHLASVGGNAKNDNPILWMDETLLHFKPWLKPQFVGIYRRIIRNQGFLDAAISGFRKTTWVGHGDLRWHWSPWCGKGTRRGCHLSCRSRRDSFLFCFCFFPLFSFFVSGDFVGLAK